MGWDKNNSNIGVKKHMIIIGKRERGISLKSQVMLNTIAQHLLTHALPVPQEWLALLSQLPRFVDWAEHSVVQNIPLTGLGQLPWPCSPSSFLYSWLARDCEKSLTLVCMTWHQTLVCYQQDSHTKSKTQLTPAEKKINSIPAESRTAGNLVQRKEHQDCISMEAFWFR